MIKKTRKKPTKPVEDEELLITRTTVTRYRVDGADRPVTIEMTHFGWAVRCDGMCLSRSGDWVNEPLPSARSREFYAKCRWPTAEAAVVDAVKAVDEGRC